MYISIYIYEYDDMTTKPGYISIIILIISNIIKKKKNWSVEGGNTLWVRYKWWLYWI